MSKVLPLISIEYTNLAYLSPLLNPLNFVEYVLLIDLSESWLKLLTLIWYFPFFRASLNNSNDSAEVSPLAKKS